MSPRVKQTRIKLRIRGSCTSRQASGCILRKTRGTIRYGMDRRDIFARPRSITIATILEFSQNRPKFSFSPSFFLSFPVFLPCSYLSRESDVEKSVTFCSTDFHEYSQSACNIFLTSQRNFLNTFFGMCNDKRIEDLSLDVLRKSV